MCASQRFSVDLERDPIFPNENAFVLRDNETGSSARVIPSLGNNLMSFVAGFPDGRKLEVMLETPGGEDPGRASKWGNPILFPFPNRVRDGLYTFLSQSHHLTVNTLEGNHIHGLVRDLPWKVEYAAAAARGAIIRSSLSTENHPEILRQYPFPFVLTVTYTLAGNALRLDALVENTGNGPLPMGFGIHPYFGAPLEQGGTRDACLIQVPAESVWEVDDEKLPTGRKVAVPPSLDFRRCRTLGDSYLDDVYTDLLREANEAVCWLRDPHAGVEVGVRFGTEFPDVVVLAPSDRSTVAFEPYSCVTDAINLASQGVSDTGLIVLRPRETWQGSVHFEVRQMT